MSLARCSRISSLARCAIEPIMLACLAVTLSLPCTASEGGVGAYWPGYRSFMTGVVPPTPGLYIRNDVVWYSADAPRVVLNGFPVEDVSVDVMAIVVEPTYVFQEKLFGATRAAMVAVPFADVEQSGRIAGTSIRPSGSRFSLGDVAVSPLYLGWHKGKLHYNTNLAVIMPTGTYRTNRVVNTSRNHWTLDPEIGVTYLNPRTGWDISGALGYSINFENTATGYDSGGVLHLDYAAGRTFRNGLKVGVVGYALVQVTGDSGPGALYGPFRSRVFAIGPGLVLRKPGWPELRLRYYHEFAAENHLEGDQFVLTLRLAF